MGAVNKVVSKIIEVTPVVSAASAYSALDQIGGIQTLSNAVEKWEHSVRLNAITVVDKDKESAAINFYFFDELPTVASVDNGALDITDAEMADKCIGRAAIAAADYTVLSGSTLGTVKIAGDGLLLCTKTSTLYVVAQTVATPTYTAVDDLVFKYHLIQQ
jgi:hypothetical protein